MNRKLKKVIVYLVFIAIIILYYMLVPSIAVYYINSLALGLLLGYIYKNIVDKQ